MISIPYIYVMFSFFLLCAFYKMGQIDEEIGWAVGLAIGVLALILNHFWPGGYAGLALHAVGGFALLTVYKIALGMRQTRNSDREEDAGQREKNP